MSRNINREEALLIAAEKIRRKKAKEQQADNEYYKRITSGTQWLVLRLVGVFCVVIAVLTGIDVLVDGSSRNLTDADWKVSGEWEWRWHEMVEVEDCLFAPGLDDWYKRDSSTLELTYSPVFRTPKKLSFDININENTIGRVVELRHRSLFSWFPFVQILLLIPIVTVIFKRQKPWFNFARILSLYIILPATLMILYFGV